MLLFFLYSLIKVIDYHFFLGFVNWSIRFASTKYSQSELILYKLSILIFVFNLILRVTFNLEIRIQVNFVNFV